MINKKILGLAGLASLGLATAPLAVVHAADTADSMDSQATVTFTEDTDRKTSLNPTSPVTDDKKNAVTPLNPDGTDWSDSRTITNSALTIDYASSFDFQTKKMSTKTEVYSAKAQEYKDSNNNQKIGPNYVQVTDTRSGAAKGWTLQVSQPEEFKATSNGSALKGTKITLGNGAYIAGELVSNDMKAYSPVIEPGQAAVSVMTAPTGQGRGTSLYTMGNTDTAAESVKLEVPGSSEKEASTYTTTLNWTLLDAPAE